MLFRIRLRVPPAERHPPRHVMIWYGILLNLT